jgi:hypothetical protein
MLKGNQTYETVKNVKINEITHMKASKPVVGKNQSLMYKAMIFSPYENQNQHFTSKVIDLCPPLVKTL